MKASLSTTIVACLLSCLASGAPVYGNPLPIEVLSEYYAISGSGEYVWDGPPFQYPVQSGESGTPSFNLSGTDELYEYTVLPSGYEYDKCRASARAKRFLVFGQVGTGTETNGTASAAAVWTFRPKCNDLWLECWLQGWGDWRESCSVGIKDLSTGQNLLSFSESPFNGTLLIDNSGLAGASQLSPYQFSPTHTYELAMSINILKTDAGMMHAWADFSGTPIPVPSAAVLVLLGTAAVGYLRRRIVL